MNWRNTFLYRLYQADKVLFAVVVLYICGLLYCARVSHEEFPFLLYGMYSLKEPPKETYATFSILIDGKQISDAKLWDAQHELMMAPLINFAPVLNDSSLENQYKKREFESWLWNYVVNQKKFPNSEIEVYKNTYAYSETGELNTLKRELLFTYAER